MMHGTQAALIAAVPLLGGICLAVIPIMRHRWDHAIAGIIAGLGLSFALWGMLSGHEWPFIVTGVLCVAYYAVGWLSRKSSAN
jgi:hypothetical protein